jgi:hypothetical protein
MYNFNSEQVNHSTYSMKSLDKLWELAELDIVVGEVILIVHVVQVVPLYILKK